MHPLDHILEEIEAAEFIENNTVFLDLAKAKQLVKDYEALYKECDQLRNELASARCSNQFS